MKRRGTKYISRSSVARIRSNMLHLQYEKSGERSPLTKKKTKRWQVCLESSLWAVYKNRPDSQTDLYDKVMLV